MKLSRFALLAALSVMACAAAHADSPAAWPASDASDRAYFCGSNSSDADNTPPLGYGKRLADAVNSHGGKKNPKAAIDKLSSIAGCPRAGWTERGAAETAAALRWPAGNAVDVAWLCSPNRQGESPKAYGDRLSAALLARVDAGMGLKAASSDIRKVAGCPVGLPEGSVASRN